MNFCWGPGRLFFPEQFSCWLDISVHVLPRYLTSWLFYISDLFPRTSAPRTSTHPAPLNTTLESFKRHREELKRVISTRLDTIPIKLYTRSIISEATYNECTRSTEDQDAADKLLDAVEEKITADSYTFQFFVNILKEDKSSQCLILSESLLQGCCKWLTIPDVNRLKGEPGNTIPDML